LSRRLSDLNRTCEWESAGRIYRERPPFRPALRLRLSELALLDLCPRTTLTVGDRYVRADASSRIYQSHHARVEGSLFDVGDADLRFGVVEHFLWLKHAVVDAKPASSLDYCAQSVVVYFVDIKLVGWLKPKLRTTVKIRIIAELDDRCLDCVRIVLVKLGVGGRRVG
jgi:hypothetical protein